MRAVVLSHVYADPGNRRKLRELAGLGWSITAALPGGASGTDGDIRLAAIPVSGSSEAPAEHRWSRRALRRLLSDVRPDILQVEEEPDSPAAYGPVREAARLEIPSVLFSWDSLPRQHGLLARRRRARTLSRVRGVIGGNRMAQTLLVAAAPSVPSIALPQFGILPPPAMMRPERASLSLACVGRLVPERGVDTLLRACGQLMGPWTLTIVGTGPEQEALEAQAQRLGLASRLRWPGSMSRDQVSALWAEVDCLVVPTRSTPDWVEGYSPVLLDAMAHGVAAVVTAEGALPELAGDAGVVVGDEEALLVALQELVALPERKEALGRAGRKRVLECYVDSAIARATDAFWRDVVGRTPTQ